MEKKDFMLREVTSPSWKFLPFLHLFLPWQEASCPAWEEPPLSAGFPSVPELGPSTPVPCLELCDLGSPPPS